MHLNGDIVVVHGAGRIERVIYLENIALQPGQQRLARGRLKGFMIVPVGNLQQHLLKLAPLSPHGYQQRVPGDFAGGF